MYKYSQIDEDTLSSVSICIHSLCCEPKAQLKFAELPLEATMFIK